MVEKRLGPALELIPEIKGWYDANIERAKKEGWL